VRPATVGFLLVAVGRAACHFVNCLAEAEAGCLAGGPGERDWMRPSVVRVQLILEIRPTLGNHSLPDAVVNTYATTRSDLTSLTASTAPPFATQKVPQT